MVPIKTNYANSANHGGMGTKKKYIVIHYTANDGDSDENNGRYFANNVVKASAHFFVDDDSITCSVPEKYKAYAVGGNKYSNCHLTGGGKLYGKCTNSNSISIELCDNVKNGTIYPSQKTIQNAIELTEKLMKEHGIPAANVIRHFDVTGKPCPAYWCGSEANNAKWYSEFHDKLNAEIKEAKAIIKAKAGLSEVTIGYLASYTYGDDLLKKLAKAMK